ncbi:MULTISPECIES: hypothetical protein [unclassified Streptomyces]|uniref:hypothetical protein n=1 Tax=unclassified Streptomyces TaxID=2593676 RepID=UPI0011632C41|nr:MULTISPECIES: hypothetical protein [unclassified Streptomyces]NMI61000.1 hypothetical protein [Streptomyces sp. RLA2-12]QDN60090.1 hypothetical protein FNV67_36740 [Streptomyces sp. S1D4-20]QDN70170.1 hypothetical protein FNV66_35755 [Streptomyces sp. S1D4-14]QDO52623.1 hypothetical protein FNV60_34240 [Streptomyces sp. RLB3-5]QDO62866.1 hypothetical protein FNV59_36495 [Streptomyces sp. RLB1-8]
MTNSQLSSLEVIGLADGQLEKAGEWYKWSRRLPIATFTLSIVSIFISNPYTYIPALLALGVQVCSWISRDKAGKFHSNGEDGRTYGLSLDALGSTEERLELNKWLSRVTPAPGHAPEPAAPDYFASNSPTGMRRLCDHLQENAFWNMHQYQKTAAYYSRILGTFAAIAVISVLVAVPLTSGGGGLIFARVLVAALASGAALTQFSEVRSWKSAEAKSERLDARLYSLSSFSEEDLRRDKLGTILAVFGDYRVTTASAPPIPKWLYDREKDQLNELWTRRTASA